MSASGSSGRSVAQRVAPPLLISAIALALFSRSVSNDFLAFDDALYVTGNEVVQRGLTLEGLAWAFTTGHAANWQPLTWLSHMLDVEIFGLDPRGHHAVNVLLHALNSALVFVVCARLTGRRSASFAAALLFAVHPLHVESVSWVSGRKDVLSGVLWLGCMLAYGAYVKRPSSPRYLGVAALYVAAYMAKPVAITLPVILLLLDYWPLARGRSGSMPARCVLEKVPLFALAALFSAITLYVQRAGSAMDELASLGIGARLNNALVAYVRYLEHTVWPVDLMFPYAHPGASRPAWQGFGAAALLLAISIPAIRLRNRAPSVVVGWCWFLIALLPTIGLIQVGYQSMADRYMYLPILGLFIMTFCLEEQHWARVSSRAALVVMSVLLAVVAWQQQRHWHDSRSLLSHALSVQPENVPARVQLAVVYLRDGDATVAEYHLREAIAIDPESDAAWSNLGSTLRLLDRDEDALTAFERALEIDPRAYAPALHLGSLLVELGRTNEAIPILESASAHREEDGSATAQLVAAYEAAGRVEEARAALVEGLRRYPRNPHLIGQLERLRG